jgi:hypothetical protein
MNGGGRMCRAGLADKVMQGKASSSARRYTTCHDSKYRPGRS